MLSNEDLTNKMQARNSHVQNFNAQCNAIIKNKNSLNEKPSLLLHVCCAPCSSAVLLKLQDSFNITVYFYNPNIASFEEYQKRKNELTKLLQIYKNDFNLYIKIFSDEYKHSEFLEIAEGLEKEREGGSRCEKCIFLRLSKTAERAKENGFAYFCSTLSISPLKNAKLINEIGFSLEGENTLWLPNDFKKQNGYLNSIQLSKQYELYRQNTCGCEFS